MSLIHWFPLINNSKDYGLDPLIMTPSGSPTFTGTGKIGGTAYTNTSFTTGAYVSDRKIHLADGQSMFAWVWIDEFYSQANLGSAITGTHRYPTNTGMGITFKYVSASTGYLSVNTGDGSSRTYNTYCGATTIQTGRWYHVGFTYDKATIKLYVNGVVDKVQSFTGMSVPDDYLYLGCWSLANSSGNTVLGDYHLKGRINDVRIYDHALSQLEVSELAKGLVLHYNFEDPYLETTENISGYTNATGWNNSGAASYNQNDTSIPEIPIPYCKVLSITQTTTGQSAIEFGHTKIEVPSKTLTASVWFYMSGDHSSSNAIGPYIRSTQSDGNLVNLKYNGSATWRSWPNNRWIKLTGTFTTNSSATTVKFCAYTAIAGEKFAFNGWQVEEKDHATPYVSYSRTNYVHNICTEGYAMKIGNGAYGQQFTPSKWGDSNGYIINRASGGYNNMPYSEWHKTAGQDGSGFYSWLNHNMTLTAGKTYTISLYAKSNKASSTNGYFISVNSSALNNYYITGSACALTTTWKRFTSTFTVPSGKGANDYCYSPIIYNGPDSSEWIVYICGVQIEEGNFASPFVNGTQTGELCYDSSGYNNHGTLSDSTAQVKETAAGHGKYALLMNAGTTITHPRPLGQTGQDQEWTINTWIYPTAMTGGTTLLNNFNLGNYLDGNSNTHYLLLYCNAGSNDYYKYSNIALSLNTWYMVTFVFKNSTLLRKIYINAVDKTGNGPDSGVCTTIPATITCFTNFAGYVGDYQIYATALSADQITTLYKRKAAVARNNTIIANQFVSSQVSQELMYGLNFGVNGIRNQYGHTTHDTDGSVVMTGQEWLFQTKIPVIPNETLYYDITYSHVSGNLMYIGFEYYNINGGTGQNNSTRYITYDSNAHDHTRIKGTITIPETTEGAATGSIQLRILNDWNSANGRVGKIHNFSLRRIGPAINPNIDIQSVIQADDFREYNYNNVASIYKDGFVAGTQLIEN